jgi:splicing factor 3B subunit 2
MGLSTADRNRHKRERKKREREERRKQEEAEDKAKETAKPRNDEEEVEIEYVAEPVLPPPAVAAGGASRLPEGLPPGIEPQEPESMESVLRRFHQRAAVSAVVVSDDERDRMAAIADGQPNENKHSSLSSDEEDDDDDDDDDKKPMSKRKLREVSRPSVAELKRRVKRPDLVEAHDITAADPDFLIHLKSITGTVPVPRHWGRKRNYLQGKRGFEKAPFQLPDFIKKTGAALCWVVVVAFVVASNQLATQFSLVFCFTSPCICLVSTLFRHVGIAEIRDTVAEDEAKLSAKQKNRSRVAPKMGSMDVDYKTLHEAFFKHQTKPTDLTKFGDLYYEGKELETVTDRKPGGPYSNALREALGMTETSPPPWLINMQRYGVPPSYPDLSIPGLNAALPNVQCQYGYHHGGWGKSNVQRPCF